MENQRVHLKTIRYLFTSNDINKSFNIAKNQSARGL